MPSPIQLMYESLSGRLQETAEDAENIVDMAWSSMSIVEHSINDLREYIRATSFENEAAEIQFFKYIKPRFYTELIYFSKLYHIELGRPTGSIASQKEFYQKNLLSLHLDFERHAPFYQYYRSGASYLDDIYFKRRNTGNRSNLPFFPDADPAFSTGYDYKVAKLTANERLSNYLNGVLRTIDQPAEDTGANFLMDDEEPLTWKKEVIYIAELIYALYAFDAFKNENVTIARLARYFSKVFNIKIEKIHKKLEEIRRRTRNRTVAIDLIKQALIRQMEEDDVKNPNR